MGFLRVLLQYDFSGLQTFWTCNNGSVSVYISLKQDLKYQMKIVYGEFIPNDGSGIQNHNPDFFNSPKNQKPEKHVSHEVGTSFSNLYFGKLNPC